MFSSKQKQLFSVKEKQTTSEKVSSSIFVRKALKKGAETLSGNGALKYKSTGNPFVDQFGKVGAYKEQRSFEDIAKDCESIWAVGKTLTVKFILYLRMITRIVQFGNGTRTKTSQKGAEMRHEGIMRMMWLYRKAPESFWKNIFLFIAAGSWKDIIQMLQYDLVYHGWDGRILDWSRMGDLILSGLEKPGQLDLIKKYLPQIKANSACTTVEAQANNMIAKWLCARMFGSKLENDVHYTTYARYRNLKSSGKAHQWQQLISQQKFDRIDFSSIHGRAINLLVKSGFLKKAGLEDKYKEWAKKPETEVKYTGFVSELFEEMGANGHSNFTAGAKYGTLVSVPEELSITINKQFATLIEKGKADMKPSRLIGVRDTSSSMGFKARGSKSTSYAIAKSIALYFSEFLSGPFANCWIEFNRKAVFHQWKGETPLEKWFNDDTSCVGTTDFLSVIRLFCELKAEDNQIKEEDFPTGIICMSDAEFNPVQLRQTNVEAALQMLRDAKFYEEYVNNFVIVLWNIPNKHYGRGSGEKFETFGNVPNVFYMSGYNASIISFLTNKIRNAEELFEEAMRQDLLELVEL